jgi:hypothetical protein
MELTFRRDIVEKSKKAVRTKLKNRKERTETIRQAALDIDWITINPQHINSYGIQRKDF